MVARRRTRHDQRVHLEPARVGAGQRISRDQRELGGVAWQRTSRDQRGRWSLKEGRMLRTQFTHRL